MKFKLLFALTILLFFPVSCGINNASPTQVSVTRVIHLSGDGFTPFQETVNNADAVQHLYEAALALPSIPGGVVKHNCFVDYGLWYHLDFFPATASFQQMDVNPSGCWTLRIGKTDVRQMDQPFLNLFSQTIKVTNLFASSV